MLRSVQEDGFLQDAGRPSCDVIIHTRSANTLTLRMDFTLIAHRGLSASFPENTLIAFDAALEGGWANFETDVQLSSDLVPLVCASPPSPVNEGQQAHAYTQASVTRSIPRPYLKRTVTLQRLVLQIVHDEELKRIARSDQAKRVCNHVAAEITAIDVGSWFDPQYHSERIPTLDAILRKYRGRAHLHLVWKDLVRQAIALLSDGGEKSAAFPV